MNQTQRNTINVLGLSVGAAVATLAVRLLLLPVGFMLGRTSNWLMGEGGNLVWYASRSLLWAAVAALAATIVAVVHNEFVRRRI